MEAPESASHRNYFYVGGVYVDDESNPGERVMQGQMYVEQLTPLSGSRRPFPLVFIHGAGQTASVRFSSGLMITCKFGLLRVASSFPLQKSQHITSSESSFLRCIPFI